MPETDAAATGDHPKNTFEGFGKDPGISRETLRNWVPNNDLALPESSQKLPTTMVRCRIH
ncbi:hypothetical protein Stube_04330 [Streptomyces tubercidicus]|uniref:Uncharacterized protein n=1 Tax=Streptomyces tubercidicus TaxID=47759 RepID=A0A640UJP9_9ACTN|nr:hypothetical protein Stube_04330 [Streptomyces tubercidicus]